MKQNSPFAFATPLVTLFAPLGKTPARKEQITNPQPW